MFENPFYTTFRPSSDLGAAAVAKPIISYTLLGTMAVGAAACIGKAVMPVVKKQIIEPAINNMAEAMMESLNNGLK